METKVVKGRGPKFLEWTLESHQKAGWEVVTIERGTLGSITVVFTRPSDTAPPSTPTRPDL